jgi:hypothetical protein
VAKKAVQFHNNDWFQLKISLNNVKPAIWRRFVVPANIKLPGFS